MRQQNRKTPLIFRIGLSLFCLWVFFLYLMGNLYARYASTAWTEDGARVAEFSFQDDLDPQSITLPVSMAPGETQDTVVRITNDGEVTIRCIITVANQTGNLPIASQTVRSEAIACGATKDCSFSIAWPAESNSIDFVGKTDALKITVTVEQVD